MKKRCLVSWLIGLMLLTVAGCGSSAKYESAAMESAPAEAPMMEATMEEEMAADMITSENGIEPVIETSRKLIKTVYLDMQTKEFDDLLEGLSEKVKAMNGYIEHSSISGSNYYYQNTRYASFTLRIPSDRLDEFIKVAGELGNVTHKEESVEDVTLQYVDTESRKEALETEQDRLLELLAKAENMEDLLAIESRLSEVRYELENYGSRLRLLDNQIDYSTVHLNIEEVERITEVKEERTFFEEIADRFNDNLYNVGRDIRRFAIRAIGSLPILAVWAVIIAIAVLVLRLILSKVVKRDKLLERRRFFRKKNKQEDTEN